MVKPLLNTSTIIMRYKQKNIMKKKKKLSIIKMIPLTALLLSAVYLISCNNDEEPTINPTVTATSPVDNETDVVLTNAITATFSTVMNENTASKFNLKQATEVVTGNAVYDGTTLTFTSTDDLLPNTVYTATIDKSAVDKNGTSMLENFVWSFTTGAQPDVTKPTVTESDPANNSTGVARNKIVTANFSEEMNSSTINTSTFILLKGTTEIPGTVTYSGTAASFTPTTMLEAGTTYTAKITTGSQDLAGNALAVNNEWNFTTSNSSSGLSIVNLGTAGNYVILAKTAINNNPTSAITGDVGLSPAATSYITGFALTDATGYATSSQVTGKVYAADMASPTPVNLTTAVENMITAYNDAAGRPSPDFLELATGNIGGLTLEPGLYKWTSTVTIPGDVVLSGGADDVWIFQISGDLTMSSAVNITMEGGAQAKNVFWQVAGEVTVGTTSHFEGVILSMTAIILQTGASFNGRALAQTAVILDGNAVTQP